MADYYVYSEDSGKFGEASELWRLFDYLAGTFGKKSDFDLRDDEIQDLFDYLQGNESIVEGQSKPKTPIYFEG